MWQTAYPSKIVLADFHSIFPLVNTNRWFAIAILVRVYGVCLHCLLLTDYQFPQNLIFFFVKKPELKTSLKEFLHLSTKIRFNTILCGHRNFIFNLNFVETWKIYQWWKMKWICGQQGDILTLSVNGFSRHHIMMLTLACCE